MARCGQILASAGEHDVRADNLAEHWRVLGEEAITGMADWRVQHPKATLTEIEAAIDERLGRMRARMLEDAALASQTTDLRTVPKEERPCCPTCGVPLQPRSQEERDLMSHGGHAITLERSYATCPTCGEGFFPPRR
jgi:RNase P subunit RPR2